MPKLLLDEDGHVVTRGDAVVVVDDDGNETDLDALHAVSQIKRLSGQRDDLRTAEEKAKDKLREAERRLKGFDGLDADAAREALRKLEESGEGGEGGGTEEIERLTKRHERALETMKETHGEEKGALAAEVTQLRDEIYKLRVSDKFLTSKFVRERMAWPAEKVQAIYEPHFVRTEDGGVVALFDPSDPDSVILSKKNSGENASFEEAIEQLVERDPDKDIMLKGEQTSGTHGRNAMGRTGPGRKVEASQFGGDGDKLRPKDRLARARAKQRATG